MTLQEQEFVNSLLNTANKLATDNAILQIEISDYHRELKTLFQALAMKDPNDELTPLDVHLNFNPETGGALSSKVEPSIIEFVLVDRKNIIEEWLAKNSPSCLVEKLHLMEDVSPEKVYWNYGYYAAIRDMLDIMGVVELNKTPDSELVVIDPPTAAAYEPCCGMEDRNESGWCKSCGSPPL